MGYKPHPALEPRLIGYDPVVELALDHLARFIDMVVDKYAEVPEKGVGPGQPEYDPRPLLKLLLYGYAMGVFSWRRLEQNCKESLPYMLLVRDDRPSYHTICTARVKYLEELEWLWYCLFDFAVECGLTFVGRIAVDSGKFKADVSKESVVRKKLFAETREKLKALLAQADIADAADEEEGLAARSRTGIAAGSVKLRDILRSFKKSDSAEPTVLSPKMAQRVHQAIETLEMAEDAGLSHVSLTDPDARMMPVGAHKTIAMGHSLEVGTDSGLLVHSEVIDESSDTGRLPEAVESAIENDPAEVTLFVPDTHTACDLKRGNPVGTSAGKLGPQIPFTKVEGKDAYICPQGNILKRNTSWMSGGRQIVTYRATKSCEGCPLASACLKQKKAKRRTIRVSEHQERLVDYLSGFNDPQFQSTYHQRGPCVETVFAMIRRILGFDRWHVRGAEKVESEAMILTNAYQLRKLHKHWAASH